MRKCLQVWSRRAGLNRQPADYEPPSEVDAIFGKVFVVFCAMWERQVKSQKDWESLQYLELIPAWRWCFF